MATLQDELTSLLSKHYTADTPGAVILVAKGDHILYQHSAGVANIATGTAITSQTNFRLASVSKQFTAMGIQLLAAEGLLRLQDELSLYFPELAHLGSLQLWHLLHHTSGLPDFEEYIPADQTAQLTDVDVLKLTAAQRHLLFSPGSQFRYSNTAFVLLGLLIERVKGLPYGEFLREHLFRPLQMNDSLLYQVDAAIPHRAMGYTKNSSGKFILSDQSIGSATRGDGCIYTSTVDYLKWHQALSSNTLFNINNKLKNNLTAINEEAGWSYGMGWFYEQLPKEEYLLLHSGDTCGFTNLVMRYPKQDVLVACFSNIANNQNFLQELLQVLKGFPDLMPSSQLAWQLPQLTR